MSVEAVVRPDLLIWSRETAGLSVDDAAHLIDVRPDRLAAWEAGQAKPTIGQLRRLAEKYKRPLNVFFLPKPPTEPSLDLHDFRTLPDGLRPEMSRSLRFALRNLRTWRLDALDLYRELELEPPPFRLSIRLGEDAEPAAKRLRDWVGLTLEEQKSARFSGSHAALNGWRRKIEDKGVLVFQASGVPVEEMRGASSWADVLPAIILNSADNPKGRIFTLLHELVHLALSHSGICEPLSTRRRLPHEDRVEVFCNLIAAATLVPSNALRVEPEVRSHQGGFVWPDEDIQVLAERYRVSRFVLLRRLEALGLTSAAFYSAKHAEWMAEIRPTTEGGGDGDRIALAARGSHFSKLVLTAYSTGKINLYEASRYLGVRPNKLDKATDFVGL